MLDIGQVTVLLPFYLQTRFDFAFLLSFGCFLFSPHTGGSPRIWSGTYISR
jgi:hypothetical protein